jgi:hypothetical protein
MKGITLAALAGIGFIATSGHALAENGHAYNGSYCDNYYGSQASAFDHQFNGIRNASGAYAYVSCPVVVDEIDNTAGTTQIWVHYTGTGTISCSFFSMNGNGTIRQSQSASRVNTGWFSIPNITTDDYWGSYSMYCGLPANGVLNTIWVGEKN